MNEHQLLHLNTVEAEAKKLKLSKTERDVELPNKKIDPTQFINYLDKIIKDIGDVKKSGIFPCDKPSDIHDYLEKETVSEDYKLTAK